MRPYTKQQILTWLVYVLNIFLEVLTLGLLENVIVYYEFKKVLGRQIVYCIAALLVIIDIGILILGWITTKSDPSDPVVKWERFCKITEQAFPDVDFDLFCQWCNCHVMEKTKHCGKCKRCTMNFDHHCSWLNNCIGSKNYKPFFLLVTTVLIQSIVNLIIISFILYTLYFTNFNDHYIFHKSIEVFI